MRSRLLLCLTVGSLLGGCTCGVGPATITSPGDGGGGGGGHDASGFPFDAGAQDAGPIVWEDFPEEPLVDPSLPSNIASLFEGELGAQGAGPCLTEPTPGAMIPRNWTPLYLEWAAPPAHDVFEVTLHAENQARPLRAYTAAPTFELDADLWRRLASNSAGLPLTVRLRSARLEGAGLAGPPQGGEPLVVHLAPVMAPGSVVYWSSSGGTSLKGFTVGDLAAKTVLTPATAGLASGGYQTNCISCHTSSPDGKLVLYSRDAVDGSRAVDVRTITGEPVPPGTISPAALALLNRHKQTAPVMSRAHYSEHEALVVTAMSQPGLNGGRFELVWTDLHAQDHNGWGVVARDGDPRNVSSPAWRHDGTALAYVSSAGGGEGVIADVTSTDTTMDIYTVPWNGRQGGPALPLPGASDPNAREFYPVYSPGDVLLAFNRTDQPVNSYDQPSAELFLVPAEGGQAVRLTANDPPACSGQVSPGLTNSWARWAPEATAWGNQRFYWLVFSSKRRAASGHQPQLYISAVVTRVEDGVETLSAQYPALYVRSQVPSEANHTPAWDHFQIADIN
jgi:hypothetical protein